MFTKIKMYFKSLTSVDIYRDDMDLYRVIKELKLRFRDIDPMASKLLYTKIVTVDKNILKYIVSCHNFLLNEKNSIPDILYINNHSTNYLVDFLKDDDGKILLNSNIYLLELLDKLESLYGMYELQPDRKLKSYIIHVLNIYRDIYKEYVNDS